MKQPSKSASNPTAEQLEEFVSCVWEMGRRHGRPELPWRNTHDPYAIYISEVMLQQTQVARVLCYWEEWMGTFPTLDALSAASTSDVLERWQGLGYNRRALACKKVAEICSRQMQGKLPEGYEELLALPGIGPATAAGIMAFAHNLPAVYIETNVREVYIGHFFADADAPVSDKQLAPLVELTCPQDNPRGWYYALLDYGAHLKFIGGRSSSASASHTRQSAYVGSWRQKRAFVLREALAAPGEELGKLHELLDEHEQAAGRDRVPAADFDKLVGELATEGFFAIEDNAVRLL